MTIVALALAFVAAMQWWGSRIQEEIISDQQQIIERQDRLIGIYEKIGG